VEGAAPTGTGLLLAGIRDDTLIGNRIENNNAWGVLITAFPDSQQANPNNISNCHGGEIDAALPASVLGQPVPCVFDSFTNHVVNNTFKHNGSYANPSNGDIADVTYPPLEKPGAGANCYSGNTNPAGLKTWPTLLATVQTSCSDPATFPATYAPHDFAVVSAEAICASTALAACPAGLPAVSYPQPTAVHLKAIPHDLPSMPDPCAGVPDNPWCEKDATAPSRAAGATRATAPTRGLAATGERAVLPAVAVALLAGAAAAIASRRRSEARRFGERP
jgi:hypothetical protein